MITTIDTATNGKKPVKKTTTSAKPAKTTSSSKKAIRAADIAKKFHVNPKQLRKRLRAKGIRAPYDAAAIVKIEHICKGMAKAH